VTRRKGEGKGSVGKEEERNNEKVENKGNRNKRRRRRDLEGTVWHVGE
jgi:hypothetical protein